MTYVVAYAGAAIVFFALDFLWLGIVAKRFYRDRLGHLLAETVNMPAALGFYALYLVGIVIFAVAPALSGGRWPTATAYGALFGFFAYLTYNMTNLATMRDWPVLVSAVDLTWGTVLSALAATGGYLAVRLLIAP